MNTRTLLTTILIVGGLLTASFGETIVTLKSGDVLRGDTVSDTNDVLQIRAFSANRTISSLRNIAHADIQNIYNETPAEAAERIDYFALAKFQLFADQEQSVDFYNQWIAAFGKFLKDYPKSDKNPIVQQHLEACQAELKHVTAGEVKFADRWMTPEAKKPLSLNKQLADLEKQRDMLAKTVAVAQGRLQGLLTKLQTLQDTQQPVYATRLVGPQHYAERYATGQYQNVPNPERPIIQRDIVNLQQQIGSGGTALASLDTKIRTIRMDIPQAERAYEIALAKAAPKPAPVVAPPPPAPVAQPVVEAPAVAPEPWFAQHWKGMAIVCGVVLALLLLSYPLKRFLQTAERAEVERDEQRRVARENLKQVFERIFPEGERPAGPNEPEGEVVPIGKGEDEYGGGRWFVINDSHIWAVQNNGRETDNWVYNNVTTTGHGAVGARIPMDPELAEYIRTEGNAAGGAVKRPRVHATSAR